MFCTPVVSVTLRSSYFPKLTSFRLYSLEGPRKDATDANQKQLDIHFKEIKKLRSAQNSHVPVSGLPAEVLSEVFLCIVESALQYDHSRFARGTFRFRQVCQHWNQVAIGFPQLWARWVPNAFKAWHLFNARSRAAPTSLTRGRWCTDLFVGSSIQGDPTTPDRIRIRIPDLSGAWSAS